MFAPEMLALQVVGRRHRLGVDLPGQDSHAGHFLQHHGVFHRFLRGGAPGKGPVEGAQHRGHKQDQARLKKIFSISLKTILAVGVSVFILGWIFTEPLIGIFVEHGTEVYQMAHHGYRLYSICFLLVGTNVFASAMFTALSDGKVSAILSFFRTLVFEVAAVMLIPLILELDGVWISMPVAEACSLCLSIYFFKRKKDVYHYM